MPENIEIILPDGSRLQVKQGATGIDIANKIGKKLAKDSVAIKVNGKPTDMKTELKDNDSIEIITEKSAEGLQIIRHSTAHIMAEAVMMIYPEAKFGIGPAIENGFYYDFDLPGSLNPDDLPAIEKKIAQILKRNVPFEKQTLGKNEAIELFEKLNQPYKVELINEIEEDTVTIYKHGDFADLCKGPHVPNLQKIKAFKLMSVAGAYWRGSEKRPMLQRIYAVAFGTQEELDTYINRIEEAKKRDHRVIGKQLDLFSFQDEGPGFPFFHPNGMTVLNEILEYWRKHHVAADYKEIKTPILLQRTLWEQSGHWENYRNNMYFTQVDDLDMAIKPMNCPGGILVYKTQTRSYREFPLRILELGQVHRHELSGVLHGLFRVRSFMQDDAHIYCLPDQIVDEITGVIELTGKIYKGFVFENWELELSTRPEKAIGTDEMWHIAETSLKDALEKMSLVYKINAGDGAFYGPKIDFHITDSMGRKWQCATIQLDFAMPERFDLEYTGADNKRHRPVMIHRAILGSIERFFGILIEHYAGAFPAWLAPLQAIVIPIADRHNEYAGGVRDQLKASGIRVDLDDRREQTGSKIRDAQIRKIPYMLIVGDKEIEKNAVAVRERAAGDLGAKPIREAIGMLVKECAQPS